MDYDFIKDYSTDARDAYLRNELGEEKCKILDKYDLKSNYRLYWERIQEKYPIQEYFSHKFAKKSSSLGMIFHIYRLCFAKVKYFENNWNDYEPCVYNSFSGKFETCPLWDMEYLRKKNTYMVIDLRSLAKIHCLKEFKDLCLKLEQTD